MRSTLAVKLGVIFSALLIFGFGAMGVVTYQSSKQVMENCAFKRLHCRSKALECRLESFCCARKADIKSKATSIYIRSRLEQLDEKDPDSRIPVKEIIKRLRQMMRDEPRTIELFILNSDGQVIASTDEIEVGRAKSDRRYFIKGRESITGITEIYHSPAYNKPTMLAFTPVIQEESGDLLGVAVERISLREFSRTIKEECALVEGEEVYALDKKGGLVFGSIVPGVSLGKKLRSPETMEDILIGKCIKGAYKSYKGIPVIGECRWLAEEQCALIVEQEEKEAFAPVHKIANWIFIIGVILTFLAVVFTAIIVKHLVSPVLKLKDAADRIASGDLDTAVDIRTKDEIGILADSFNRMARDLKASRQKLEGWAKALELKVRERTLELREKLEELEKFNKLSVDRELKMMELKKEIERLKNKVDEK